MKIRILGLIFLLCLLISIPLAYANNDIDQPENNSVIQDVYEADATDVNSVVQDVYEANINLQIDSQTKDSVSFSWTAPTDDTGVFWYEVYRNNKLLATVDDNNYNDVGLEPGSYIYYIKAYNDNSNLFIRSNEITALIETEIVLDIEPPTAPFRLQIEEQTDNSITLSWTGSSDNVGVVGYEVYRDNIFITTVKETLYTDTTIQTGTTYIYYVRAIDAAGNKSVVRNS